MVFLLELATLSTFVPPMDMRTQKGVASDPVRTESSRKVATDTAKLGIGSSSAFSMLELLVVMMIMLVVGALVVPVVNSLNAAGNLTQACYEITATLEQARAYAMANNTYVFVGIAEVDASVNPATVPQVDSGVSPYGRVAIAVVASKDGAKHYMETTSAQGSDWQANYADASKPEYKGLHLASICKLRRLENVHLSGSVASLGAMARPSVDPSYVLGNSACVSQTPFSWPLGSQLGGGYQYRFDKILQFDPQGVVRITAASNGSTISRWIEVGLAQAQGNRVSANANAGVIQIDTLSGATRIYRP
jgi:Tfp pilus assembly protein FimT